ncbi:hypothetical protein M404DRAFT_1008019 [Pisolithus tinctorius Marx 270]|uniref:Uncharacterized protein n=1 Tax=Pisolithus tinctorius Marx 270 TaxID=870435 RepID=A0A0C3NHH6_PISTI|nr:hypothetical protein M404DRAFT_1008019 [Pisolithus tinctorius Marx 270]
MCLCLSSNTKIPPNPPEWCVVCTFCVSNRCECVMPKEPLQPLKDKVFQKVCQFVLLECSFQFFEGL